VTSTPVRMLCAEGGQTRFRLSARSDAMSDLSGGERSTSWLDLKSRWWISVASLPHRMVRSSLGADLVAEAGATGAGVAAIARENYVATSAHHNTAAAAAAMATAVGLTALEATGVHQDNTRAVQVYRGEAKDLAPFLS